MLSCVVIEKVASLDIEQADQAVVASSSMHPALKKGDIVRVTPLAGKRLRRGDVVVFVGLHGKRIMHRLVSIKNAIAVTKGDNCAHCDAPIAVSDIIGVIEGMHSEKELFYYFLRNKLRNIKPLHVFYLFVKRRIGR